MKLKISSDVVFRTYEDIMVLYNIRLKNYAITNSLGSDIWHFILEYPYGVEFTAIVEYIAESYEVDQEIVVVDVNEFVNQLFCQNMILIDDEYCMDTMPILNTPSEHDIEGEIIRLLQDRHQIYSATFELTYSCNENCVHCYAVVPNYNQNKKRLDLNKCKELIDELYRMNCFHLIFTGGDPFVFDDFIPLLRYVRSMQFSFDVYTNGQAIARDPMLAEQIGKLYPRTFYISLYGATAKTHDSVTQISGSFDRTIYSIKLLKEQGVTVVLNVMLLKINSHETQMIIDLANQLGVQYRIGLSLIRKNDGNDTPLEYFVDDTKKITDILEKTGGKIVSMDVGKPSKKTGLLCGAGAASLCVSPNGDVYPCVSLKRKLGSVFSSSLDDIWNDSANKKYVYSLTWENTKECKECDFSGVCPHCIGISKAECGNEFECNYSYRKILIISKSLDFTGSFAG